MSKLLKKYDELKKKDPKKVYLFKNGIFYILLNEDARKVSKELNLKLTDLGPEMIKCGFPVAKLEKYTTLLNQKKIAFELIQASSESQITSKNIIKQINNIDLKNTTPKEAFDFIYNIQQNFKNIQ